ncbi:uncharacterized protein LOC124199301 [Daphnia pulex]|uniref:uncharacterized protein LOC124199301 n=1 Tax=Daphnia pulex TaxID=6669 RepID=UPI001EE046E3|nr:uncharacterized protein LOC124199301 [Daphnia pulex]
MASILLIKIVVVSLLVFALETSSVAGVTKFGECNGLRLENTASGISPSKCVQLGGTCCDLGSYMTNEPKAMKATEKCLTCYKSSVKVKCTGTLIRSKPWNWGTDANTWVTAKTCIAQKGQCCTGYNKPFNPKSTPNEFSCNNCYSGTPTSTGCSGKLLSSIDFTPKVCVQLGGNCCDGDWQGTTVGSAFCTSAIFNSALLKNCNLCYSGSPKVVV